MTRYIWPGDEAGLIWLVESLRVLEPLFVGAGVAAAGEIGMETFEQRLRDERERPERQLLLAWV